MHLSMLAAVVALTASMSTLAASNDSCLAVGKCCTESSQCCSDVCAWKTDCSDKYCVSDDNLMNIEEVLARGYIDC
ncbi:hypothetical protein P692DRAFT_20835801 [Suillus brevipes Sb2]|nr:hypothetical protein P692DRAFT_20835801 [Suillus brevipes Sb2]